MSKPLLLRHLIEAVRHELTEGIKVNAARKPALRFTLSEIQLEAQVELVTSEQVGVSINGEAYVLKATLGGERRTEGTQSHTVRLTLKPDWITWDEEGRPARTTEVRISDDDQERSSGRSSQKTLDD